jgi:hypothetical protein
MTQCQRLLVELEKGRRLSNLDMILELGIGNHTARISELRYDPAVQKRLIKRGLSLHTEMVTEHGKTFARYYLKSYKAVQEVLL